ncbi:DUF4037 domain-containing protein [Sinosporangium siamense]|uniref:DUF4037 domain-containing protein n=2 Tax=Sinosporangium siamense TaxID=1367973 RepID=A0A919VF96_9ACTN|nr:DUF4037 domain-containing protein [Sinosporangium siamense]GII95914.1 hypothetical protein Ssi02_61450 [Sinosporangium siamense]
MPGIELSRAFYGEVVRPLLTGTRHSAALIGPGSEVLSFDTSRSMDHDWGPRVLVFTEPERVGEARAAVAAGVPERFHGFPTLIGERHGVVVSDPETWTTDRLGFDPRSGMGVLDWLATPWQALAEITGGEVFHDGLGALEEVRRAVAWYPEPVWRYVLACQWRRIAVEESFPGRCAEVGDDLGATVETARLVREMARLAMLMRRRYPPYAKWLGSALARLPGSAELGDALAAALAARDWPSRERHMSRAYELLALLHNRLSLTGPLDAEVRPFHDRPFKVIGADRFAAALAEGIGETEVAALPRVGSVDQFAEGEVIMNPGMARTVARAVLRLDSRGG